MFKKDTIYQMSDNSVNQESTVSDVVDFAFDEKVARVFPDMVHRSIPGYASLLTIMQAVFRQEYDNKNQILIYDLGCSVGGVTLALSQVLSHDTRFIGVDLSPEMLLQYDKAVKLSGLAQRVQSVEADIQSFIMSSCQAITINFTLQFLPPEARLAVLQKCYRALDNNGLVFIAEKTKTTESVMDWHEQFKRNNGYSDLEIAQKRLAIENVMRIDEEETFVERVKAAGFSSINPVFHALGFKAWVIKK